MRTSQSALTRRFWSSVSVTPLRRCWDQVVVGALMQLERVVGDFYTVYSCQIQRVHWEEATHGTDT